MTVSSCNPHHLLRPRFIGTAGGVNVLAFSHAGLRAAQDGLPDDVCTLASELLTTSGKRELLGKEVCL